MMEIVTLEEALNHSGMKNVEHKDYYYNFEYNGKKFIIRGNYSLYNFTLYIKEKDLVKTLATNISYRAMIRKVKNYK